MSTNLYNVNTKKPGTTYITGSDGASTAVAGGFGQVTLTDAQYSAAVGQFGAANVTTVQASTSNVTQGPYPYIPKSPGQHNLAITSSTGLTVPAGATYATVQASGGTVKYTTDGTTTPTSSVGMTLSAGNSLALSGALVLANFRAISASGTLDVEYFA